MTHLTSEQARNIIEEKVNIIISILEPSIKSLSEHGLTNAQYVFIKGNKSEYSCDDGNYVLFVDIENHQIISLKPTLEILNTRIFNFPATIPFWLINIPNNLND